MEQRAPIHISIFYFITLTTLCSWILILIGGIVHGTGSSLACPDWPTCYGSFFPEMKGGIFFEHGHRVAATLVGVLTIVMNFLVWKWKELRYLALLALTLVIFQGILGGLTVIYRLPTAISTAHLGTSMIFLATLVWISLKCYYLSRPLSLTPLPILHLETKYKYAIIISLFVVYFQIILGGLVRHLGAGLACTEIPLCQGVIWPTNVAPIVKLHMAHRIFGVIAGIVVSITGIGLASAQPPRSPFKIFCYLSPFLIILQIILGLWSVASALELFPVTLHLGIGALIWMNCVLLFFFSKNPNRDFPRNYYKIIDSETSFQIQRSI